MAYDLRHLLPWGGKSPVGTISLLPITFTLVIAYAGLIASFGIFETILHSTGGNRFSTWISWSEPLVAWMAQCIPAINQLADHVANTDYAARAIVLANLIAFDWLISLTAIVLSPFAIVLDYTRNKDTARAVIERAEEGNVEISVVLMGNILFLVLSFVIIYTSIGYVELFRFYTTDFGFWGIAVLFFWFVSTFLLVEALTILRCGFSREFKRE